MPRKEISGGARVINRPAVTPATGCPDRRRVKKLKAALAQDPTTKRAVEPTGTGTPSTTPPASRSTVSAEVTAFSVI